VLKIAVITISDRAYRGEYEDLSGPEIKKIIENGMTDVLVSLEVVPDDREKISNAILSRVGADYVFTCGGTGISPRDITPQVTEEICDLELPGISEMLRRESFSETKFSVLSRGFSGMKGKTIIVNFPGSVHAARLCMSLMLPILEHGKRMAGGGKHHQ
jgi:molybdopterin adenylyltransferase